MKLLLSLALSCLCFAGLARAQTDEIDSGLEALAVTHIMNSPEIQSRIVEGAQHRNFFEFLEAIRKNIEGLKESFLATFDTNGNGWIDPGEETENLKKTLNDVLLLLADTDKDGALEPQELAALVKQMVQQLKSQVEERVCNKVLVDSAKLGDLIVFHPLLKAAKDRCTLLGLMD